MTALRTAAATCRGCDLWERSTQTVFGEVVGPRLLVPLGAVAAQSLLGTQFKVTRERGRVIEPPGLPVVVATVHPSSILRAPEDERQAQMDAFVADLLVVAALLAAG